MCGLVLGELMVPPSSWELGESGRAQGLGAIGAGPGGLWWPGGVPQREREWALPASRRMTWPSWPPSSTLWTTAPR